MFVAAIETASNQRYIFATNRLREQVGGSELIHRVGTTWIREAAATVDGVRVLQSTSGKAVLLAEFREPLDDLIWRVTSRALAEAPGLAVHAGVHDGRNQSLGAAVTAAFGALPTWDANSGRNLQLPPLEVCSSSGGPGQVVVRIGESDRVVSGEVAAKRVASDAGFQRMMGTQRTHDLSTLEEQFGAERLAVIHADGNGLGRLFLNLHSITDGDDEFAEWTTALSEGVATCTRIALDAALAALPRDARGRVPLVPIVVGGDDVTVVCDARAALDFTEQYLRSFRDATREAADISHILAAAVSAGLLGENQSMPCLSASAGVAVVKPHFPFWSAYELAAGLAASAKTVQRRVPSPNGAPAPICALDVHVMLDSRTDGLEPIRSRMELSDSHLWGGPWLVGDDQTAVETGLNGAWIQEHQLERLRAAAQKVAERDTEGRRVLPSSQVYRLRSALVASRAAAEEQYRRLCTRYGVHTRALGNGDSVYHSDGGTLVLDAIALEGLM